MHPLGQTRTVVQQNHAFIAPDSHVSGPLVGWKKAQATLLISPQLGAKFSQYLVTLQAAGTAGPCISGVERFIYVLEGSLVLEVGDTTNPLKADHYAYLPANCSHRLQALQVSRLLIFERYYLPLSSSSAPEWLIGHKQAVDPVPFMGDADTQLRLLLPDSPAFDMAVNLFTFQSGAALPFVETHVMEHGLLFLEGQGIYRLADQWYPIQAGDAIWMAPYCPQWFAAIGKTSATYLYYKDVNRDPLTG